MENKHYKIREDLSTEFEGRPLYRIEALKDLLQHNVKRGSIGGFVESYNNLSDNAWVYDDAKVFGDARVYGNARVSGNAEVEGNAQVFGCAWVCGNAWVRGNVKMYESAWVFGSARVFGDATVCGDAKVFGDARVSDNSWVSGDARVYGNAGVYTGNIEKPGDVKNITGERYNITILPAHIHIGCQLHTKEEWWNFKDREILEMDGKEGLKWWKTWKPILMAICDTEG